MADNFRTDVVELAQAQVLSGTLDPSAGAGFPAPEGSVYLRNVAGSGQWWQKLGAADTDWIKAISGPVEHEESWSGQTHQTIDYAAGFYDWSGTDDNFSPAVNWGSVAAGRAAHVGFILGALTVDELTLRVSGTSIDDNGVQSGADTEDIVIPNATAANAYFETAKKWQGQVAISVVSGTAQVCNWGWVKYHDNQNKDFTVRALEVLWDSDSTDNGSNITLLHHRAAGWTFNAGADPTPPPPIADRNTDYPGFTTQFVGHAAWKRVNLDTFVNGADSEGILFCFTSGSTGLGTLSFVHITFQVTSVVE